MAACVYIPVQNSEEEVRVVLDQLPPDVSDIIDILKAEQAPLDVWLTIAREYFKQGKTEQFRQILEQGSGPEIEEYYADVSYERIAILNALGAYYTYRGKIETKQREKDEHFASATQCYNKASKIDMHEPSTWVGKGQLLLAKGDLEQAAASFKIVLDGDRENVSALLGQACALFNQGRYTDSLEFYKRALRAHPDGPGASRLGIGLCRFKLGQYAKARQAFERVLELEPENVEALVALGIMDLQTNEGDGIRKGMEKMQLAFEIYPYCPMALNYLANHYFFTGQHFLVEQLTETALAVTDHGLMKAHSYYNLARSYHSKGDYHKAKQYYMLSVKDINKPHDFVLPYYGLGQVHLKLEEFKASLSNFEKVLEVHPENGDCLKAVGHIHIKLHQTEKALAVLRKATRVDPRDAQAFLELGELLIPSDAGAALDALKTAQSLLKRSGGEVPIELLNSVGVLQFERGEFELAEQTFKEALGDGVWLSLLDHKLLSTIVDSEASSLQHNDMQVFQQMQEKGISVDLPWEKVTTLFNYARLLEQMHLTEKASILYRLILFKYPDYLDAYLRLSAIAKARNNIQLSIELLGNALKIDDKHPDALSMLGTLELKSDDEWFKAKETFRAAKDATAGKDSYATICLGNWNYYAAGRSERKGPKIEAAHLEKAKELYTKVLVQHRSNMYAACGAAVVLAEKGQFDVSKDMFMQVQEAASGSIFVQMPDVWVNLAHVYFAQGQFALAVKMYQNCLMKFYYNTDTQVLLYLARTHYEAEQWQECKKTLLRAIHMAPSNYTLRFDAGVAMQKFSASTLQKTKRTADEIRRTVGELRNTVRLFTQLSAMPNHHFHGKVDTHVEYCKHLLGVAEIHCEAVEREEEHNRHRLEVVRQGALAAELIRKAEEQSKIQAERQQLEEELNRVREQEENFQRKKEQWKNSAPAPKRKERSHAEDEEGGESGKRKKGGKRRKRDKKSQQLMDEAEPEMMSEHEEMDEEDGNTDNHEEGVDQRDDQEDDASENEQEQEDNASENEQEVNASENEQDPLAAAGLEDSDAEDDVAAPPSAVQRRKHALSESDEE